MKNKGQEFYFASLLKQLNTNFGSSLFVDFESIDKRIRIHAGYKTYQYGDTVLIATFDNLADFCDQFNLVDFGDYREKINPAQIYKLYLQGKACLAAYFDVGLSHVISFWKYNGETFASDGADYFSVVPKEYSEPETWDKYRTIFFEERSKKDSEQLKIFLEDLDNWQNQHDISFDYELSLEKKHPPLIVKGLISRSLLGKNIRLSVYRYTHPNLFPEIFDCKSLADLNNITLYHLRKLYDNGICRLELQLQHYEVFYFLYLRKDGEYTHITDKEGYKRRILNFNDTDVELVCEMRRFLAQKGVDLDNLAFPLGQIAGR